MESAASKLNRNLHPTVEKATINGGVRRHRTIIEERQIALLCLSIPGFSEFMRHFPVL
jgi:hypothetical protein